MQTMTNDELRIHVRSMWSAVADRWARHADDADRRGAHLTDAMLRGADLRDGDDVLELACGPGGTGLAAAERVGPGGHVVLSDVVPEMAAIAGSRAKDRGLTNVSTAVLDLEAIDAEDASFDVVLCREGLMFAVDPRHAAAEIRRVLRPGGRVAIAVWGPRTDNPWLGIVFDAVTAVTGFPVPPPGVPGPFALDDRAQLGDILETAGFASIAIEEIATPLRSPSFEHWWSRTSALAGPIAAIIARLDADSTAELHRQLRVAAAPYTTPAGLELPGLAIVAIGVVAEVEQHRPQQAGGVAPLAF